jgi:hypothetical protein
MHIPNNPRSRPTSNIRSHNTRGRLIHNRRIKDPRSNTHSKATGSS